MRHPPCHCQGGGRGFESRRPLERKCRSGPVSAGPLACAEPSKLPGVPSGSRLVHDFVADGSVHGREAEFDVTMWVSRRALRLLATEHPSRPMNPPPSRGLCSGTDRGREERWGSRSAGNGAGPFADGLISRCPGTGRRMGRRRWAPRRDFRMRPTRKSPTRSSPRRRGSRRWDPRGATARD
jgi:hypothetical protein